MIAYASWCDGRNRGSVLGTMGGRSRAGAGSARTRLAQQCISATCEILRIEDGSGGAEHMCQIRTCDGWYIEGPARPDVATALHDAHYLAGLMRLDPDYAGVRAIGRPRSAP